MKTCSRCGIEKSIECFHKDGARGSHSWCKDCFNTYHRQRGNYGTKDQRKQWNYSARYNLSIDDVAELVAKQNNKCAICGGELKRSCVDHDHNTGKVRGVLCHRCNILIGGWDDTKWKEKALRYINANSH